MTLGPTFARATESTLEISEHGVEDDGSAAIDPTPRPPTAKRSHHLRLPSDPVGRRAAAVVSALAVGASLWALIGSQRLFPYLSDDHDEGLYLLQATALRHGHLFPPAPEHADAFRPFLSVVSDGRFVLKYTPVHASILAVGIRLAHTPRLSLGLIAAGVVVLSYALAKEVLGDQWLAALASVFLVMSPLFVIQSATFLPYCSLLLLLEGFAFALLRGVRSNRRLLLSVSGLVFGLALFARPFDAVLWALPLGLYVVVSQRSDPRKLVRHAGWFALGAVVPVFAVLAYYRAATGSPFRSPFNLLEPQDTLGFGPRRLLPGQPELFFTPAHGTYGVLRYALLTSFWGFGGLVLIGLFLAGALRRMHGPEPWLVLVAVSFSCGYLFFWGTYGTSLRGSLTSFIGPFYFLPVLVPVTFLAAKGFGEVWRRDRVIAALTFVGMLTVSGYLLSKAFEVNLRLTAEDRRLYAPITAARVERALVFLPPLYGPQLLHPFAYLQNDAEYDGRMVYALDRGEQQNLALVDQYPGRELYRLVVRGRYRANPTDPGLATSLEPLTVVNRPSLQATLTLENPTDSPSVVVGVSLNGRKDSFVLDTDSYRGKLHEVTLYIGPQSVEARSPVGAHFVEAVEGDGSLSLSVSAQPADGGPPRTVYERHLAYETDGRSVTVLLPGVVSVNELGPVDPLKMPAT